MKISDFEQRLEVSFKNKAFLEEALTHRSYINENPKWKYPHNERFEFLGDAVLELAVSEALFRKFPNSPEGDLTNLRAALVRTETLSSLAHDLGINEVIRLSRGEAKDTGRARDVILANAFEAIIGAIYFDQNFSEAEKFIVRTVLPRLDDIIANQGIRDAKSRFQELAQEKHRITPSYKVLREWGPDHEKKFRVGVFLGDDEIAQGEGLSKQEAQQSAAKAALEKKKWQ